MGGARMNRRAALSLLAAAPLAAAPRAAGCRQLITMDTRGAGSTRGTVRLWVREKADAPWLQDGAAMPAVLGRNGMRPGLGLHPAVADGPVKREGDGCSPAGLFALGTAFGPWSAAQAGLRWPWQQMTPHHAGVDDPQSAYYNTITDSRRVKRDWRSAENMLPASGAYRWGLVVQHNAARQPGAGSCIFLHVWTGPRSTTAGCTALAEADMVRILRWLDPRRRPLLAQWPRGAWPAVCAGVPMPAALR
jgi:L,D-peptidoglycan transpeptidase YkuD (ErfK/YbiS/YcfS/YnhG family)